MRLNRELSGSARTNMFSTRTKAFDVYPSSSYTWSANFPNATRMYNMLDLVFRDVASRSRVALLPNVEMCGSDHHNDPGCSMVRAYYRRHFRPQQRASGLYQRQL